jgi:transposase
LLFIDICHVTIETIYSDDGARRVLHFFTLKRNCCDTVATM